MGASTYYNIKSYRKDTSSNPLAVGLKNGSDGTHTAVAVYV